MPSGVYRRTEDHKKKILLKAQKFKGKNNPNWKGGKPKCPFCGKQLNRYASKSCRECYYIHYKPSFSTRKKLSLATKKRWKKGLFPKPKRGKQNHSWKGDEVGYTGIHEWIRRNWVKPKVCSFCKGGGRIEWANKNGNYKREKKNFIALCVKCHRKYDKINPKRPLTHKNKAKPLK